MPWEVLHKKLNGYVPYVWLNCKLQVYNAKQHHSALKLDGRAGEGDNNI